MLHTCKSLTCNNPADHTQDFCEDCLQQPMFETENQSNSDAALSVRYPQYYKSVSHFEEVDVYAVHQIFNIQDPSGAIQHASKKLLLSGARTGGKSQFKDIKEARDTLTRWLQLNPEK